MTRSSDATFRVALGYPSLRLDPEQRRRTGWFEKVTDLLSGFGGS